MKKKAGSFTGLFHIRRRYGPATSKQVCIPDQYLVYSQKDGLERLKKTKDPGPEIVASIAKETERFDRFKRLIWELPWLEIGCDGQDESKPFLVFREFPER